MASYYVPPVDPNWDYATQWRLIHHMKYIVDDLIIQMEYWDEGTKETNEMLIAHLQMIEEDSKECINLPDFESLYLTDN